MRNACFTHQRNHGTRKLKRKTALHLAMALAGLVLANGASAQMTTQTLPQPTSFNIDMTNDCAGGGTRVVHGTYDAASGALDTMTTLTACVARNGDKFDGTTSTKGKLLATETGFEIGITASVDTTIVRSDLSMVHRVCTVTKQGTYTNANQTFDGTTERTNCSVTGQVLEHEGLVEHLLRPAQGMEDGGGLEMGARMIPPQPGEDRIRFRGDGQHMDGFGPMGGHE